MTSARDARNVEIAELTTAARFEGARILEIGCGDGRLTWPLARLGASVLAFDPDEGRVREAMTAMPAELAERVELRVAALEELDVPPARFDVALLSWSL